jgi:sugar/nucleoside kinase (ribokinase family)
MNTQELHSVFGIANAELATSQLPLIAPKSGATLVVTHGSEAIFCVTAEGVHAFDVEPITHVVDRTGGGDAFDAGFLASWLKHGELAAAVSGGLESARQVLGQIGGSRRGYRL